MSVSEDIRYRFAFDVGGTFTDLILSGSDGSVYTAKRLGNQKDVAAPILAGLTHLLSEANAKVSQVVETVVGATTAVTNLVIERDGSPTGLITTKGFRDVLEIGRELRYDIYDLHATFPEPIVPRQKRVEIDERILHDGTVMHVPSQEDIELAVRTLIDHGVEAIAVCLLHSYANPIHEQQVAACIRAMAPDMAISLSSDVIPEIREYERTVATVLNAYAMPKVSHYLEVIERALKNFGINAVLQVMQSNGGVLSRQLGQRIPMRLLESGPAAGVLGSIDAASRVGMDSLLAFDMGGTTAKACLVTDGEPEITIEFEAARIRRFKKGSGWPIRLPVIDLIEIGAGGGSIAYVDATGLLKVGPRSAGSSPGPACYGAGGEQPTVTDAALVLGYLDPNAQLSATVTLSLELAEEAIRKHVAEPLEISVVEAAAGIYRIVCEQMASSAKVHAVEKGRDIRKYTMLAFGGAAPLHAREVAKRAGCTAFMVPSNAGVFSAVGLLVAPIKIDAVRSYYTALESLDAEMVSSCYDEMSTRLRNELDTIGVPTPEIKWRRIADMRYAGQGFEVATILPGEITFDQVDRFEEAFHQAYEAKFGHRVLDQRVEVMNWRLEATYSGSWKFGLEEENGDRPAIEERRRAVYFPELGNYIETPVLKEHQVPGEPVQGPALIEQPGSTIVVGPTDFYHRDRSGNTFVKLNSQKES